MVELWSEVWKGIGGLFLGFLVWVLVDVALAVKVIRDEVRLIRVLLERR
jgi:hypothetical protein